MRRCMKFWNRISEFDDDREQWNSYESVFVLDFDEDGNLSVDVKKDGTVSADTLIKSLLQAERYNEIRTYAVDNDTTFVPVKNFQVVYGIPKDSTNLAYEDYYTSDYYLVASGGGDAAYFITLLVIAAFACFMCSRRVWKNEKMPDYLPKWRYMEAGIFGLMMSFAMCDIYIDTVCDFPYTGKSGYANVNVWSVLKNRRNPLDCFCSCICDCRLHLSGIFCWIERIHPAIQFYLSDFSMDPKKMESVYRRSQSH